MTVPLEAYLMRAANAPKPDDWVEEEDLYKTSRFMTTATAAPHTFFADISEYQEVVNSQYPYQALAHRAWNGKRIDNHAKANWAYGSAHLPLNFIYPVYKPGQNAACMAALKNTYGAKAPHNLVPMPDMESGSDFAGPGNHSPEANQLLQLLGTWTGRGIPGDYAYANGPDYAACWAQILPNVKKHIARYSATDPSPYGWQYYGALNYPSPAGYPRSCAPFGGYVDMNVINKTLDQILIDFGIVTTPVVPMPVPVGPAAILSPAGMKPGQCLVSPNKSHFFVFQADGNCVVYNRLTRKAIWNTGTSGKGTTVFNIQNDGNLVAYAGTKPLWQSNTDGRGKVFLQMQDDGNLVAYLQANHNIHVWQSNTDGK